MRTVGQRNGQTVRPMDGQIGQFQLCKMQLHKITTKSHQGIDLHKTEIENNRNEVESFIHYAKTIMKFAYL